jgi:hypothetical protein
MIIEDHPDHREETQMLTPLDILRFSYLVEK